MYTQLHRFVATIFLLGLLFQSCGSPSLKIVDDTPPERAGTKINHPASATQRMILTSGSKSAEDPMKPKVAGVPVLGDEALSKSATEALVALANKAPDALAGTRSHILHGDCSSTHWPSISVNVFSQHPAPSSSPHASSATSQRKESIEQKLQYVALDKDAIARRKDAPRAEARAVSVVAARPAQMQTLQSTSALHAEKQHSVFSSSPRPTVQHALTATEHKEAHPRPAINSTFQRYPSAQGHQVCFKETDGKWLAQVQDGYGREQLLPVVCAPEQTPAQAIHKLASKVTGQHKYWVHVLKTDQPPWAPRVVYLGALGLRGGGVGVSSAPDSDDETNNINPVFFYGGSIKARADFYQAAGFWYAKVSYNNQYNGDSSIYNRYATAVPVKWPFTSFSLLFGSLSANDLNASSNRICFKHLNNRITSIDCIKITSSIEDIRSARRTRRDFRQEMAQRERRREERRRQAEVRRQEEERRRQEEARRQEEERRRQEEARREQEERKARLDETHRREERRRQAEARRQEEEERRRQEEAQRQMERLEAIKSAEAQAVQELARIEEAERIAALETMKEQLEKSFESQALPELNLSLGELGIAYQNIPSQVLYDAIKTAMTQGAPIVPLLNNPDDIQAAEESVNELLTGMQEAFNTPGVTLPPALEKVFAGVDVEVFRPYARALVAQVEAAQAAKAALIEANEIEVQESIARVQASTEALHQKNQAIAQQKAEEKEAEEAVARERQARYHQATKDIAVLSSEHLFVPGSSVGFLEELQDGLKTLQEDLVELSITAPLPRAIREDINYLWHQINKDQKRLTPLYRHMRRGMDHHATDMLYNEQAKEALLLRTDPEAHPGLIPTQLEVLKKEAAMIKKEKDNTVLAREILEKYDHMRQTLGEMLATRQVFLIDCDATVHAPDWKADYDLDMYEPDWENDYSQEELVACIKSCVQVPQDVREQVFVASLRATAAELFANIGATLGQQMPVTTQDFLNLLQSAPQLGHQVTAYYPYIAAMPTNSAAFARIHGLVMHAMLASESACKKIEVRHLNELKKRIHQLRIAIQKVLSNPQKLLY